jgi:hypothetical protein
MQIFFRTKDVFIPKRSSTFIGHDLKTDRIIPDNVVVNKKKSLFLPQIKEQDMLVEQIDNQKK